MFQHQNLLPQVSSTPKSGCCDRHPPAQFSTWNRSLLLFVCLPYFFVHIVLFAFVDQLQTANQALFNPKDTLNRVKSDLTKGQKFPIGEMVALTPTSLR